jgi:hypothetical protein
MSRPRLFTGGITDDALRAHLAKLLRCDPMTDNRVLFWATLRLRIAHARRHAKKNSGGPHLTQQQRWAVEQGWPRPRDSASSPEQGIPDYGRGRPMPRGMHFADKYLLQMFPKLLKKPLSFAGLERLHHVDYIDKDDPESVLLPTPEEWQRLPTDWDTQCTGHHVLVKVRNRSKDRIRAARAQQGTPGVPDGAEPHAKLVERPEGEPSLEEMGRLLVPLNPVQIGTLPFGQARQSDPPGHPPSGAPKEVRADANGAAAGKGKTGRKKRRQPAKPIARATRARTSHQLESRPPPARATAKATKPRR